MSVIGEAAIVFGVCLVCEGIAALLAFWLLGQVQGLKYAIQDLIYDKKARPDGAGCGFNP